MKSKPLPPLKSLETRVRDEGEEKEEEEMEIKDLVASTEEDKKDKEDKDDYYFEDPSNISKFISTIRYSATYVYIMFQSVTARHDIPEAEFPDYVKQMHQNGDKKFNLELQVSEAPPIYIYL